MPPCQPAGPLLVNAKFGLPQAQSRARCALMEGSGNPMDETQPPASPDPRPAPPESIHAFADAELALRPLPPWAWLGASFRGGFRASGLHLLAAWAFFEICTSAAWAIHLRGFTSFAGGWSALPQHWGEMLSAKDLWNLAVNGEMGREPFGTAVPCLAAFGLAWMFWASWRHQAEEAALPARLRDWILGLFDALVIGLVPLLLPFLLVSKLLTASASTGIPGLGWLAFIGRPLLLLAFVSALMGQWWLCRLNRAAAAGDSFATFLAAYPRHLKDSFLRLWSHPVQWTALHLGGAALRAGLTFGALFLGWRWGGGGSGRVWAFLGVQVLATLVNAFLLGWLLRLTARYWRRRREVGQALAALEAARTPSILATDRVEAS